jgi:hypothetical protein
MTYETPEAIIGPADIVRQIRNEADRMAAS